MTRPLTTEKQRHYLCTSYCSLGKCTHQAAPRRLLGAAKCIVWVHAHRPLGADPRLADLTCALYTAKPWPRQPEPNP